MAYNRMAGYPLDGYPPTTQFTEAWGVVQPVKFDTIIALPASAAYTTNQQTVYNPFPYARLYDIVVESDVVTAQTIGLDVYNSDSGGASYLTSPFSIVAPGGTYQVQSARFHSPALLNYLSDPYLTQGWNQSQYLLNGVATATPAKFSLRLSTPSTGGNGNLRVTLLFVPYDNNLKTQWQ